MRSEFSVVLDGPTTPPELLSRDVSNLRFKKVMRGGFASVAFDLKRKLNAADMEKYANVAVFDIETGVQVGGGRLLNPGKSISDDGEKWEVSAVGEGLAATQERKQPYVLYETRYDVWHQAFQSSKNANWSAADVPSGSTDGLLLSLSESIASGKRSDVRFYDAYEAEQKIALIAGEFASGRTDTGNRLVVYASNFDAATFVLINGATGQSFDSTTTKSFDGFIGTDFVEADGIDNVFLRYERTGGTFTAAESDWCHVRNLEIQTVRLGRDRQPILTAANYNPGSLEIEEVIVDILARFCPTLDVEGADIDFGTFFTFQPSTFAFFEGISAYGAFEALIDNVYDPSTWAVWERQGNGLFRFEWRPLPDYSKVRYEVMVARDFRRTGAEDDEYNEYWVMGTNSKGRAVTSPQRFYFPPNSSYTGKIRSKTIDLADSSNFSADAADLAQATNADDKFAATAARFVASERIFDRDTGRWVKPFEIEPGYNMRVLGVRGEVDILNLAPVSEGARVYRIESNEYDVDNGQSVIELNSGDPDQLRQLANLTAQSGA